MHETILFKNYFLREIDLDFNDFNLSPAFSFCLQSLKAKMMKIHLAPKL